MDTFEGAQGTPMDSLKICQANDKLL